MLNKDSIRNLIRIEEHNINFTREIINKSIENINRTAMQPH